MTDVISPDHLQTLKLYRIMLLSQIKVTIWSFYLYNDYFVTLIKKYWNLCILFFYIRKYSITLLKTYVSYYTNVCRNINVSHSNMNQTLEHVIQYVAEILVST